MKVEDGTWPLKKKSELMLCVLGAWEANAGCVRACVVSNKKRSYGGTLCAEANI